VNWHSDSQTITVEKGSTTVELTIGSKIAKTNDKINELPVKVRLVDNCTYIPLRVISVKHLDIKSIQRWYYNGR